MGKWIVGFSFGLSLLGLFMNADRETRALAEGFGRQVSPRLAS